MLHGLEALLPAIARGGLDEADVYRRERLYRQRRQARVGRGVLECPLCGTRAARFLPFGLGGRRNSQCPRCGSVERHRFLWLYLTRRTRLLGRRLGVLHTAPEPCLEVLLRARPNLRYVSVDRFNPAADLQADLTALPLATASVNLVLSSHVLEHIPDDAAAIAELARVLRPGGTAIVLVPCDPHLPHTLSDPSLDTPAARLAAYGHPYHYRIYGADLPARLAAAGLPARVVASRRLLTPHQRRRFRINRNYLLHCRRM